MGCFDKFDDGRVLCPECCADYVLVNHGERVAVPYGYAYCQKCGWFKDTDLTWKNWKELESQNNQ